MVLDNPAVDEREAQVEAGSTAALSAYIDLSMDDVVSFFTDPGADAVLAATIQDVLAAADELVSVHAEPTLWASSGNLRVAVCWRVRGPSGDVRDGTATISLLVVQSGDDPITELLVSLPVQHERELTTATVRRILDGLTSRLEAPTL
ncbi:MAG: hypothetical protein ACOYXM_08755 [Actinomycetota bacterium]